MTTRLSSSDQARPQIRMTEWLGQSWLSVSRDVNINRGWMFGALLIAGLAAFELFNFSTTEFALADLIGDVRLLGLGWATLLAFAFCVIDFAGLARLFTPYPQQARAEVWYLTGAWFLGAAANAVMTWWAISIMMLEQVSRASLVSREELLTYVPVFIAGVVWVTRVCLIGAFALAGPHLFAAPEARAAASPSAARPALGALVSRLLESLKPRPALKPPINSPELAAPIPAKQRGQDDKGFSPN